MLKQDDFLIRDDLIFLNHGSFGACPKAVFKQYQAWQLELERQPIDFLTRRRPELMRAATAAIAADLNAPADELVFVTNATVGLNTAAKSLRLTRGDEILTTNHEYGAVNRTLEFVAAKSGASIVRHSVRLPYRSDEVFIDDFFADVTENTRVIVMSHITSPTALIFPVGRICRRARQLGILTIIDGAHAPGQLSLDLQQVAADMYSGNFHKWLCAPKGSAFLHVRREHHEMIEPLAVSHGWRADADFTERHEWHGTRDISAYLTVPTAIDFQRRHNWQQVRADCHALARWTQSQLCDHFGLEPLSADRFSQMVTIPLPECDVAAARERLYGEYHIEVPVGQFEGACQIRVSFQAYNSLEDAQRLVAALKAILA